MTEAVTQPRRRIVKKLKQLAAVAGLAFAVFATAALISGCKSFGHRATGARLERMEHSPQWQDGHFENPQPLWNDWWGSLSAARTSDDVSPHAAIEPVKTDAARFDTAPASGLRVTWFGHSSMLVELDGHRVLTDPVWSNRVSPISWIGPTRWFEVPLPLEKLPKLDAVVISHDHYDHLDMGTVVALAKTGVKFVVPLGVGAHLQHWGIPEQQLREVDWWEETRFGDLTIVAVPARHASGRTMVLDMNATLWAGYALLGPQHRVYYSGDTGLFPAMKEIGSKLGPFDLTMIECGQYNKAWPDWHIGPEQAVVAHTWVQGKTMLPVHWGALQLASHGWTEPVERVLAKAAELQVSVVTPRPGESFEVEQPPVAHWWPQLPFVTGANDPIVSTKITP